MVEFLYPNALFDQIILVPLQLLLEAVCVDLDFLTNFVDPCKIWDTIFILRHDLIKRFRSRLVASNIIACFRMFDSQCECF